MENGEAKGSLLQVVHIEDNEDDGELIRMTLKQGAPCSILRVTDREQFESAIENKSIDLILSDSKVPGFDSLSALAYTRQRKPNLPFVFVSGQIIPWVKEAAFALGATDYVPKDNLTALTGIVKQLWEEKAKHVHKKLPPVGEHVIVQCQGFRCLGFLDRDGNWRDFARSELLPEVLDWFKP